jgi:hypothetical protein
MKIYSDTLVTLDIGYVAHNDTHVGIKCCEPLKAPRLRKQGWNVRLYRIGSRRHFNTGRYGSSGETGAASWDDYGHFLAALYEADPAMRAGPYTSREHFHQATHGTYLPANARS